MEGDVLPMVYKLAPCLLVILSCGCGYDKRWESTIVGKYSSKFGAFEDVLLINGDGGFSHKIVSNSVVVVEENGKWWFCGGVYRIAVSQFSRVHRIEYTNGVHMIVLLERPIVFGESPFWPVFNGNNYNSISSDIYMLYRLNRVKD
jgi:hypothetical protein